MLRIRHKKFGALFLSVLLTVTGLICIGHGLRAQTALFSGGNAITTTVFNQFALFNGTDTETTLTFRQIILSAGLSAASGTRMRVTGQWGVNATGAVLTGMYIGQVGASQPDFKGNQAQVLWGGSASPAFSSDAQVVSDWTTLGETYDNTKDYMVAWGSLAVGYYKYNQNGQGGTVAKSWFLDFDNTQYSQTVGTGFSVANQNLYFIGKIEVQ